MEPAVVEACPDCDLLQMIPPRGAGQRIYCARCGVRLEFDAQANPARDAALAVTALVAVGAIGYGVYWALVLRHHESTDNAYVQAPMVQITPQVAGTVLAVLVDDTDVVKVGQPLVRLDPADARLALERAESQLAQTVREVRTLYANNAALDATIKLREAEVARMQADVARANDDVARRRPLNTRPSATPLPGR